MLKQLRISRASRAYDRGKAESIRTLWSVYRQAVSDASLSVDQGDPAAAQNHLTFAAGVRREAEILAGIDALAPRMESA